MYYIMWFFVVTKCIVKESVLFNIYVIWYHSIEFVVQNTRNGKPGLAVDILGFKRRELDSNLDYEELYTLYHLDSNKLKFQ